MIKKQLVLFSLCLWAAFNFLHAQNSFVKDSLDSYVNREMARWQVPGLAVAIIKDGKVILTKGYGIKDIETKEKVDEFTLFQIASNSKAFTGTAIALLDYQKKLSLDDQVTKYFPWFKLYEPTSTQLCTVRDLLTHRIGHGTFQGDFYNWGSNLSRREIIEGMGRTKPIYPFRYKYGYCNAGYITAGELIPEVTGMSWDAYLKSNFFDPLGMVHTHTSYEGMKADKNACTPHTIYRGKLTKLPLSNIENMGPSASINSCVSDMSKWLLMQLDSGKFNDQQLIPYKVLQETRKSQMVSNDYSSRFFPSKHFANYGLGWNSYDYMGKRIWEHSGGANGFVTKTEFIPEAGLGVIVYTNSDENALYEALTKQIIESYLGVPYRNISEFYYLRSAPGKVQDKLETDSLYKLAGKKNGLPLLITEFEGTYSNTLYGQMKLVNNKGKLEMHLSKHPNNIGRLQYLGENKFLCTYTDLTCGIQVLPVTISNGKVQSIQVKVADFIDYEWYEFKKEIRE